MRLLSRTFSVGMVLKQSLLIFAISVTANAEISMPVQQQSGELKFMTGGVAEEAELMQVVAKDYALEIVLIQKLGAREEFLADVEVQILDINGNAVLETTTEGPYLFANLPAGRYSVIAKFRDEYRQQKVLVSAEKHLRLVMWWPIIEPPEDELE